MKDFSLSLILPTINESENLSILIPRIVRKFNDLNIDNYQILVVDDGSTDDTIEVVNLMNASDEKIQILSRNNTPSLPNSIFDGITQSKYDNVMWMDADGSMTPEAVEKIILKYKENDENVVVGSRFVSGGGYKGVKDIGGYSFFKAIRNVRKSKDSVAGMVVSIIFNKFLKIIFPENIKDVTSGFIIGKKKYFRENAFNRSSYGEYFLYMLNDLYFQKIKVIEVGYICETRVTGESKTASSLFQLIKRGIPYINAAIISRRERNENTRL